jgi:hypothetical protein
VSRILDRSSKEDKSGMTSVESMRFGSHRSNYLPVGG